MDWKFYVLVAFVPFVVVFTRPRAAWVLLGTVIVTWAATTLVVEVLDLDNFDILVLFLLVIMPVVIVGVAMFIATSLAPRPRRWFDAGFLAMCGWWIGFVAMLFAPLVSNVDPWQSAIVVALPSVWAAAGAAFVATNER